MFLTVARLAHMILTGVLTAVFLGTWIALSPTLQILEAEAYLPVQQDTIATLTPLMPPIVLGSIAAGLAVLAILHRPRSPLFVLTGISVALVLVTVVATIVGNWPLNDQTATWTLDTMPADWAERHDTWEAWHTVRAFGSAGAALALAVAAVVPTTSRPRSAARSSVTTAA